MITRIASVPSTHSLRRYSYHMLQASLKPSVFPISTYPIQQLYAKQQGWSDQTSRTLSRFYDATNALLKAAAPFEHTDLGAQGNTDSLEDIKISQTRQMIDRFNELHHLLTEEQHNLELDVDESFQRILRSNAERYASIGIAPQADGSLTLDYTLMKSALQLEPDYVDSLLTGAGGIVTRINAKARQLQELPSSAFTSSDRNPYQHTFLTSLFSWQAARSGLFINQLF